MSILLKEKICVQETFVFLWRTFSHRMSMRRLTVLQ
ncbi:hypothetical protein CLOBOL_01302 [Enterocloster bolteae ATCC BAA-613]|uniref:Uncharacterized protein n=1 Tax=Enterocloster bolteae (strain ATCC BAA-613 / DSM 15670 / CCUG 46953 / JCM 12243 / WAL 16351) TaxID=411902 RepID=A8RKF8_ENTBW|nr:hypothetical protein CLOBOL_01302 [Enterocloster bolteae ATCC BAA-613]